MPGWVPRSTTGGSCAGCRGSLRPPDSNSCASRAMGTSKLLQAATCSQSSTSGRLTVRFGTNWRTRGRSAQSRGSAALRRERVLRAHRLREPDRSEAHLARPRGRPSTVRSRPREPSSSSDRNGSEVDPEGAPILVQIKDSVLEDGALMEPSGRNQWQPLANAQDPKTAETSRNHCHLLRPVAERTAW